MYARSILEGDQSLFRLRLNGGNRHRIYDVRNRTTSGEVIHWPVKSLQNRTNGNSVSGTLHGLVGIVPGIEIGENEYRGLTGYWAVRSLGTSNTGINGRIILNGTVEEKFWRSFFGQSGRFHYLIHIRALARRAVE